MKTALSLQTGTSLRLGVCLLLGMIFLTGCTPARNTHGNLVSDVRYNQVQPYATTRYELRQIWGPPTAVAPFTGGDTWYYIGQKSEVMGIFKEEITDRRVIRVDFDAAGTVTQIAELDPGAGQDIDPVGRQTPTAGKEFTILQQLVGNLGRFNKAKDGTAGSGAP